VFFYQRDFAPDPSFPKLDQYGDHGMLTHRDRNRISAATPLRRFMALGFSQLTTSGDGSISTSVGRRTRDELPAVMGRWTE